MARYSINDLREGKVVLAYQVTENKVVMKKIISLLETTWPEDEYFEGSIFSKVQDLLDLQNDHKTIYFYLDEEDNRYWNYSFSSEGPIENWHIGKKLFPTCAIGQIANFSNELSTEPHEIEEFLNKWG